MSKSNLTTRTAAGFSALIVVLLFSVSGASGVREVSKAGALPDESSRNFILSQAGIDGRIQMMRFFERQMLANAANPERFVTYRHMREDARQRIDELAAAARVGAVTGDDFRRLEHLAVMTHGADMRFVRVRANIAVAQDPVPPSANPG